MSDSPYGGMPAGPTPRIPQGQLPSNGPSRVPLIIAIVVALLALALAAAAWFRPAPEPTPAAHQYSDQQVADAKKNLCDAYITTYRSIQNAGNQSGSDPTQVFVVAINTRLAFQASADYLDSQLALNPAAPSDLATETGNISSGYHRLVLAQIAGAQREELDSVNHEIDTAHAAIIEKCQ